LGLARTGQRKSNGGKTPIDRFERENIEFHERVRAGFLDLARTDPERFRIVDAARSVEEVWQTIQKIADREIL
jgi:dTMP kinase